MGVTKESGERVNDDMIHDDDVIHNDDVIWLRWVTKESDQREWGESE
jgi:hypothetical protein